jgi:hypothetical protein
LVDGAKSGLENVVAVVQEGGEVKEEAGIQLTTGKTVEVALSFPQMQADQYPVGHPEPTDAKREEVKECNYCAEQFKWYSRKQFCRQCAKFFCSNCALYQEKMRLPDASVKQDPPAGDDAGESKAALTGKLELTKGRICNSCAVEYKNKYRVPQLQVAGEDAKGKDPQPFAPLIGGFLQRRNWTGLRDWVDRYVVFDSTHHQILYFQFKDTNFVGSKLPSGKIAIPKGTELLGGYQNQFAISFPNGYEITFQSNDPEDTKHWRHTLLRYLQSRPMDIVKKKDFKALDRPADAIADEQAVVLLRACRNDKRKALQVVQLLSRHESLTGE